MRKKLKPKQDLETVQSDLIETVCLKYQNGVSVRALAKEMDLSPMKVRKILITGNAYATDLSTEINALYRDGKTVAEIAALLNTTPANVNSYLPYERIIYNMDERSVEADRQARYRERLKSGIIEKTAQPQKTVRQRERTNTLIIVVGKKLRTMLPKGVLDSSSDPLARDTSCAWGSNVDGAFMIHEPADPDKMIWCAEVTTAGRGKGRRDGVVLMSANCGFAVISRLPTFAPSHPDQPTKGELADYRAELEKTMLDAIRDGMLSFSLPENRVLDYTNTVARVELVRGRTSTPSIRLEELIEQQLNWSAGDDPVERFNVRGNWTTRKFGNGDYRSVDRHTCDMLGLSDEEYRKWQLDFLAPLRESFTGGQFSNEM